jgi:uncharacterized protein YaiI (UPF0178 family)
MAKNPSKRSGGRKVGKSKYRSAITGRYVTSSHGKRHPKTTVEESPSSRARSIQKRLRDQGRSFDDSTEIIRRDRETR